MLFSIELILFQIFRLQQKVKMPKRGELTKPKKLSVDLAAIVGKDEASQAECMRLLWEYLKRNNLQDPRNPQFFTPDNKMAKVFGHGPTRTFGMAKFITGHLYKL